MQFIKAIPLLTLALCIDGFQALVAAALSGLMALAGAAAPIAGAGIGAVVGGVAAAAGIGVLCFFTAGAGCLVAAGGAALAGAGVGAAGGSAVGTAAGVAAQPVGIILGFVVGICISFTFGSMLVLFLQLFGMLDKKAAVFTYMAEVLPGFAMLPAWTALVVRCVMKKTKDEFVKTVASSIEIIGSALVLPTTPVGNAMREGTLIGSSGLAREMGEEEFEELRPTPTQRVVPMQDMRLRPTTTPYAKTT